MALFYLSKHLREWAHPVHGMSAYPWKAPLFHMFPVHSIAPDVLNSHILQQGTTYLNADISA